MKITIKNGGKGIPNWTPEEEAIIDHNTFFNEKEAKEIKRVFQALAKM